MQAIYNIILVKPEGYIHSECFREIIESLEDGFKKIGMDVSVTINSVRGDAINIVIGSHLLPAKLICALPANSIIYNFEQLGNQQAVKQDFYAAIKLFQIWDYSKENIAKLSEMGIKAVHVPVGYSPVLTRIISMKEPDIDVLFYGSINDRRRHIIESLRQAGVNVQTLFGAFGQKRDNIIARSKIVLNIHYYPTNIFEIARVSYLLANKKAVICEKSLTTKIEDDLKAACLYVPYEDIVSATVDLLTFPKKRISLEKAGFSAIKSRKQEAILTQALAST